MSQIRASLFGGFELRDCNGEELKLSTRKTRALLAFLIVEADRWHRRDRLAGLLWSDRQQAQACPVIGEVSIANIRMCNQECPPVVLKKRIIKPSGQEGQYRPHNP